MTTLQPGYDERLIGLGIALAIGLLVGMQREWAAGKPIGVRTFALIGLCAGLSALLLEPLGGWPIAAGLVALAIILAKHHEETGGGITTIVAALAVFLVGAAAVAGFWVHAVVIGGTATLLLHWKQPMHGWIDRIGKDDFQIIARFILITCVILPVLPDETYGPYDVFNPFETWLLVTLIVTINLGGYIALRLTGARTGSWVAGIVGGMVSSTATTLAYAGLSKRAKGLGAFAAVVILVASAVVYARIMVEVSVVAPGLLQPIAWPAVTFSILLLALASFVFLRMDRGRDSELPERENPAQIRAALSFAALYVGILFVVAAARDHVGEDALYAVAFVSGLTDIDALTLSLSQLQGRGEIPPDTAWRAIFLASVSNLLFKVAVAALLGSGSLRRWVLPTGAIALVAGFCIVVFWPA